MGQSYTCRPNNSYFGPAWTNAERGWNSPHAPIACAGDDLLWESVIFHLQRTSLLEGSNFMFCSYFTILLRFLLACVSGSKVNLFNSSPSLGWFPTFMFSFLVKRKVGTWRTTQGPSAGSWGLVCSYNSEPQKEVLFHPPLSSWGL